MSLRCALLILWAACSSGARDGDGERCSEPVFPDEIDGVDKPLLQMLATVCQKLYDEKLYAVLKPKDGAETNDMLDQPYTLFKKGGEYEDDTGKVISGYHIFNNNTELTASLAEYGEVIDGITDFHDKFQPALPPFAALIVQPKDDKAAKILILAWRGSVTAFDWINDAACSPTLSTRWSGKDTKDVLAHGAFVNLVENTFSRHEDEIVKLIKKHEVERAFFTGHSLGGGLANVAHLVVRGQLQKAGSPWAELNNIKLALSACTFAAPQTIVRLYEADPPPQLVVDLDASSYNIVYGCDAVPRLPGMLKFMGDLVEKVVPKVLTKKLEEKKAAHLPWWAMFRNLAGSKALGVVENKLKDKGVGAAVRFLKDKGIAEVVRHYTHQGTVVYLAPGDRKSTRLNSSH